ncbi:hypothetical protein NDA11_005196 [Ustilago hordei]|nr:hypothetical protein NDA11_005196 [Ustilago hordei]
MVVVQSPWRPRTPMDSHAKENRATCEEDQAQPQGGPSSRSRHSHEEDQAQGAGTATKRTKLKEHADGYHSGARETGSRHRSRGGGAVSKESTQVMRRRSVRGLAPETQLGTININVMMTPRSGVSVDDDEVDGVGDEIGDVDDNEVDGVGDKVGGVDDNEVDGVGDKVGGVNTSVQCVDLMLEVIPGPQWTTAFGSIYIRTANLLWVPSDVR